MPLDYYAILEIPPTASVDEVRQAYRRLARRWHPDKHGGSSESEERFKSIARAYEILSDVDRRAMFDHQRARKAHATNRTAASSTARSTVQDTGWTNVLRRYWWVPLVALLASVVSISALNLPYRSQLPWQSGHSAPMSASTHVAARDAMALPELTPRLSGDLTELKLPASKAISEPVAPVKTPPRKPMKPESMPNKIPGEASPPVRVKPTAQPEVVHNPIQQPVAETVTKQSNQVPVHETVSVETQTQWYQAGLSDFENKNYESAARWFRKAADQGNSSATVLLASMYMKGLGVAKDPAAARALYQQVAKKNRP